MGALRIGLIGDFDEISGYDGLWCVPASPYRDTNEALRGIRFAREMRVPFLGTCGGFQHAVIEYACHVLGWSDADHAETSPDAGRPNALPFAAACRRSSQPSSPLPLLAKDQTCC